MVLLKVLNDNYENEKTNLCCCKCVNYFLVGDTKFDGTLCVNPYMSKIIMTEGQRLIFSSTSKISSSKKTKLIIEGREEVQNPSNIPVNVSIIFEPGFKKNNVEIIKRNII